MFYKRLTTDWTKKKGIAQFDRSSTLKHVSLSVEIPEKMEIFPLWIYPWSNEEEMEITCR